MPGPLKLPKNLFERRMEAPSDNEASGSQSEPEGEPPLVEHFATAKLPTSYGEFDVVAFTNDRDGKEHVAIVKGMVAGTDDVLTRIHSECLTGDVFGSLKCDCGEQLDSAQAEIAEEGCGIILYLRQEGRGIGLANKIKAYSLQDQGLDTVEANRHLGFDDDLRDYEIAARLLAILGPKSIRLMTNNPRKVRGLLDAGVNVTQRLPLKILPNPHNVHYLETKKAKSGHLL